MSKTIKCINCGKVVKIDGYKGDPSKYKCAVCRRGVIPRKENSNGGTKSM